MRRRVTIHPSQSATARGPLPGVRLGSVLSARWTLVDAVLEELDYSTPRTPLVLCTWSAGVAALRRILRHPRRGDTLCYVDVSMVSRAPDIAEILYELGDVVLRHVHAKAAIIGESTVVTSSANIGKCRGAELTQVFCDRPYAEWLRSELAALPAGPMGKRSQQAKGVGL